MSWWDRLFGPPVARPATADDDSARPPSEVDVTARLDSVTSELERATLELRAIAEEARRSREERVR